METRNSPEQSSPTWGPQTKLIVGLTLVGLAAALFIQFRVIVGPLILAFILAYLLHPIVVRLSRVLHISWRWSVNIIYLVVIVLVIASFTLTGLAIVQQLQNLIGFVQRNVNNLPDLAAELTSQVYRIGPFEFSLAQFDLQSLIERLLSAVQPVLGRAGTLISTFATGAAVTLWWGLFVLLITYFLLADASRVSNELFYIEIPGYNRDLRRLTRELRKIWNEFLRGQLIIMIFVVITYAIMMLILGMQFAFGIALLAGLARFIPYLGPLVLWVVTFLVAFFQGGNYFGLEPFYYALLVVGVGILIDQVFDNLVTPRFLGEALGVHPAAVLVAAIVATRLIGIVGLLLAAPVLATVKLILGYALRKMFDLDPWPEGEFGEGEREVEMPWVRLRRILLSWWRRIRRLRQEKE
jgi:predicted PurR-regulated permease PerM